MIQGSALGSMIRAGIYCQASRVSGSVVARRFHAFSQIPRNTGTISGFIRSPKIESCLQSSTLGILGMKLGLVRMAENVPLPCAFSFRSSLHSGEKTEFEATKNPNSMNHEPVTTLESGIGVKGQPTLENETGGNFRSMGFDQVLTRRRVNTRPPLENEAGRMNYTLENETGGNFRSMDFDQGLTRRRVNTRPPLENEAGSTPMPMDYYQRLLRESSVDGGPEVGAGGISRPTDDFQGMFQSRGDGPREGYRQMPQLELNADIVHIKLMRNNSYVTLTDHKGNRKLSVSAGQVAAKGDKPGRYSGEAAAEYMGRAVKQMKIRSVVVKVSGFTFFRRKKDAILAFKDGYTHSRGDVNPVVYIEDTTRKPHNGCRLPKSRRI